MSNIVWICWVMFIGIVEAIIKIFKPDIYLFMEEDKWGFTWYNYGPDKHKYKIKETE